MIFLYFLIVFAYFPDSLEVLMVILDDVDIRFFIVIIFKFLIITILLIFRIIVIVFGILVLTLIFPLFHFLLFLQLLNAFSLPNFVIPDNFLPHLVILRIYKLFQYFFLILKLLFQFFIYGLNVVYLLGKVDERCLQ